VIKIAQLSCGNDYSGIQKEIEKAAETVGAKIVFPDVDIDFDDAVEDFGFNPVSPGLKLMVARAKALADKTFEADAVLIATCFRCAEGALIRNELRRYIQKHTKLPVVMYSFTENTKASVLLIRMEALVTIVKRKDLLGRERQVGITMGLDSGSATTKAVIMQDNQIVSKFWHPTSGVLESAEKAVSEALKLANMDFKDIEAIGTTGYGRYILGEHYKAKLVQEEVTVNSKGAAFLAGRQKGEATILDIGGMDNKAVTIKDGIPDSFTMGGICAGASGRFLETAAKRLGVEIAEFGEMAARGDLHKVPMNSYCTVFGIQGLVSTLAEGHSKEDVAAAACRSVAEQIYQQQLQEIDVRYPVIQVGGTSLLKGLVKAIGAILNTEPVVPENSQFIGAVGGALLSSGFI
jgi:putative methanogenesis marker protein 15